MKRLFSFLLAAAMCMSLLTGCGPRYEKFSELLISENYFDTIIQVISYQQSEEDFDRMVDIIRTRFDKLNKLYDIYNEYDGMNNIRTINLNAGIAPVQVDRDIIDLLLFSKEWYEKSGGRMNVAMGSV
ncbi:MAG: FAD:protein FMN transferase, partial [Oscillospiraceae bacterium]|nr:FAD:protein FMN transferase [Oscillospiraceae bacterium]